jgi:predicted Rdx family selenoprotein
MVAWIATELWTEFKDKVSVALTPVADGRLEVVLDGTLLFDRKAENNILQGLDRVRQVRADVRNTWRSGRWRRLRERDRGGRGVRGSARSELRCHSSKSDT